MNGDFEIDYAESISELEQQLSDLRHEYATLQEKYDDMQDVVDIIASEASDVLRRS